MFTLIPESNASDLNACKQNCPQLLRKSNTTHAIELVYSGEVQDSIWNKSYWLPTLELETLWAPQSTPQLKHSSLKPNLLTFPFNFTRTRTAVYRWKYNYHA